MIIKFNCSCGNTDSKKAKHYEGMLGYEAIVCTCCGTYYDCTGEHPADDWSNNYNQLNQSYVNNSKNGTF